MKRKRKFFTLIQLIVVMVIIGFLTTLGVGGLRGIYESSRERVCVMNQETLKRALELQALEDDALPSSLSGLRREHLEKAYAEVIQGSPFTAKVSYLLVRASNRHRAYAADDLRNVLVTVPAEVFQCPRDTQDNGISYGLWSGALGKKWECDDGDTPGVECLDEEQPLLADSETAVFDLETVEIRHKVTHEGKTGVVLPKKKGKYWRVRQGQQVGEERDVIDTRGSSSGKGKGGS
jgi:type II secretory pathway pseudopilin PulG